MQILNIFHVLIAISLVGFVLIQKGQGAIAGAAFGSGASGTVFGARGAGNFLSRTTWVLAALFCTLSLTIGVLVSRTMGLPEVDLGVMDSAPLTAPENEFGEVLEQALQDNVQGVDNSVTETGLDSGSGASGLDSTESTDSDLLSLDAPGSAADDGALQGVDEAADLPQLEDGTLLDQPDNSAGSPVEPGTDSGGF